MELHGESLVDPSAALGIINRKGCGKTRNIDTGFLLIPQIAAENHLRFGKVVGRDNPANLDTKYLDWETIRRHSEEASVDFVDGRASTALELHSLKALWEIEDHYATSDPMSLSHDELRRPRGYLNDDVGLLQPIYSLLRANKSEPNEPLPEVLGARLRRLKILEPKTEPTNLNTASQNARHWRGPVLTKKKHAICYRSGPALFCAVSASNGSQYGRAC